MRWDFKLTDAAIGAAMQVLSERGLLSLRITRVGNDEFTYSLVHNKLVVCEMEEFELTKGNSFTLTGVKMYLELENQY